MATTDDAPSSPVPVDGRIFLPCQVCQFTLIGENAFRCVECHRQCHGRCGYKMELCPWCFQQAKKNKRSCCRQTVGFVALLIIILIVLKVLLFIKNMLLGSTTIKRTT